MAKILFFQPGYAHYRDELFNLLAARLDILFLYEKSVNTYPGEVKVNNLPHVFVDQEFRLKPLGIAYYLLKIKPDVVISPVSSSLRSVFSLVYAKIYGKKMILWLEEWRRPLYSLRTPVKYILGNLRHYIGTLVIRKSDAVIAMGTMARKYAESYRKSESNVFVALQPSEDLLDKAVCPKLEVYVNKIVFLYLGRIIERKGLDRLIKAFHLLSKENKNVFLLIAGDGPFKQYCLELVERLRIVNVKFVGSVDPTMTWKLYSQADVFVLPAYFRGNTYEGWGLVINEALSMSLPIITTDAVGAAFDLVIDNYNGFVVRENSVKALYHAMNRILDMDLAALGENSRRVFEERNSFQKVADTLIRVIAKLDKKC